MHWSILKREHKFFLFYCCHIEKFAKLRSGKMCPCVYVLSLHASSNATWQIFPKRRILQQLSICSKSTYCAFCIANEIPDQIHAYAWKVQECNYHTCYVAIHKKYNFLWFHFNIHLYTYTVIYCMCACECFIHVSACTPQLNFKHLQPSLGSAQQDSMEVVHSQGVANDLCLQMFDRNTSLCIG